MAAWSAKALLITAGAFLVGGAIWYARAATVPLIVAALISTQLLPLIEIGDRAAAWPAGSPSSSACCSSWSSVSGSRGCSPTLLFGNLGGVGKDVSEGADKVVTWLRDNDDWAKQHEQQHPRLPGEHPARRQARRRRAS